jgi:hypothetical protein
MDDVRCFISYFPATWAKIGCRPKRPNAVIPTLSGADRLDDGTVGLAIILDVQPMTMSTRSQTAGQFLNCERRRRVRVVAMALQLARLAFSGANRR